LYHHGAIKELTLVAEQAVTGALAVYYDSLVEFLVEMICTALNQEGVNENMNRDYHNPGDVLIGWLR